MTIIEVLQERIRELASIYHLPARRIQFAYGAFNADEPEKFEFHVTVALKMRHQSGPVFQEATFPTRLSAGEAVTP